MAKLQIFGPTRSRAQRALWMAGELGLDYDQRLKDEEGLDYAAINPSGKVPAINDDGFVLTESMAINLYLAKKHGGDLEPKDLAEEAKMTQWSFWVMTEVEAKALAVLFNRVLKPEADRDLAAADKDEADLQKPLALLNDALAGQDYLVGNRFTVADLNVAAVMSWIKLGRIDVSALPNLAAWMDRCLSRPALVKIIKG